MLTQRGARGRAARTDLPSNRHLRRDIQLLERFYGPQRVFWSAAGRWLMVKAWALPTKPHRYNLATMDVLMIVPPAYGEVAGSGGGLEEFYVDPNLMILRNGAWMELPHSFTGLDRQHGEVIGKGWRYLCVHTHWNPHRDTALTAMTQLGLVLSDPWTFERLAHLNGASA